MTLYITNQEADTILDLCKGSFLKSQTKCRESLIAQLETRKGLRGGPTSTKQVWAPMRSAWPSNFIKRSRSPRKVDRIAPASKELSAEDILASI